MEKRVAHNCSDDKDKTVQIRSRVGKKLATVLRNRAREDELTMSLLVRHILTHEFLQKERGERIMTESKEIIIQELKVKAEEIERILNEVNNPNIGREIALAKTNLEQAIMWAVKGITK
jgi:hypothetical protein